MRFLFWVALICLVNLIVQTESVGLWGKKRKRQEEAEDVEEVISSNFELKQKVAAAKMERRYASNHGPNTRAVPTASSVDNMKGQLKNFIRSAETYFTIFEQALDSDQLDKFFGPEVMNNFLSMFPELASRPEVSNVLDEISNMDSTDIRQKIKDLVPTMKEWLSEFTSILDDDFKLADLVSDLPLTYQPIMNSLLKGDVVPLREMIESLMPDDTLKDVVGAVFSGDYALALSLVKRYLNQHPEIMEGWRLKALAVPEMTQYFEANGLGDALSSKRKWAAVVLQSVDSLSMLLGLSGGEADSFNSDSNKIKSSLYDDDSESSGRQKSGKSSRKEDRRRRFAASEL